MKRKIVLIVVIIISFAGLALSAAKISAANVEVTGVMLNKTTLNIEIGQTEKLIATVTPGGATNKALRWNSSNSNIVTVNANGDIKGISNGVATITVTTIDRGYTAKATINVSATSTVKSDKYTTMMTKNSLGEDENFMIKIVPNTTVSTFKSNVQTYNTMKIYDLSSKEVTKESDLIATGMKLKIGNVSQYTLAVIADANSDGKLTMSDISRFKIYLVGLATLDDAQMRAVDVNYDTNLTVVDLSIIKQISIGLIKI